ncbi:FAD-dependent oxidoreductase [Litchfieldella xinjiangensis]|uniref:FAD-dependent oxidoreductase n=1 Tax=Litchfieldella xinjiangensis TaxID=1166948 RepID=UPI0006950B7F|nr:FAD-dependent oxidoreductase [Halomonas xinjiangensis]
MDAIWTLGSDVAAGVFPTLQEDREVDVAVIGAGITGMSTALQLAEAGRNVLVLESHSVGYGVTGGSTGNLYSPLASGLASIRSKWDSTAVADVVTSRAEAVDRIEAWVQQYGIECDFRRTPLYRVVPSADEANHSLDDERDAMAAAGLTVTDADDLELPFETRGLKVENQAQFNPLHYLQGLAQAASRAGVAIHEHSPVREVDDKHGVIVTDTARITAQHIVHATHTPKGISMLQGGMLTSREYAVSARLSQGHYPEGILWVLDPFHSLRSYRHGGEQYLMAIGEKHKTGEHQGDHYQKMREYLERHFDVASFTHEWSAQQYTSPDGLPYIGRMHGRDNVYLATGFAADGLVWGTLAGSILSDLIQERDNPWHARYDARRITPGKSASQYAKENATVAKHMFKDYLGTDKLKTFDDVAPGEARVATVDGEKLAVRRDEAGELKVLSAVCPHMKCIVHWNAAETTWDCPCHGSRFDANGEVIEGPAYEMLARRTPGT